MKKFILLTMVVMASVVTLSAQKFGHLNSAMLLTEMPEVKAADSELETYQKQLITKGQGMVAKFEENYKIYQQEAQSGTLSGLQMQEREAALTKERDAIQQYDVQVQRQIAEKRQTLYQPLLDKVKAAIEKIGKENGYTMIFDTSVQGAIVHAQDTEDIMPLVKQALGL